MKWVIKLKQINKFNQFNKILGKVETMSHLASFLRMMIRISKEHVKIEIISTKNLF